MNKILGLILSCLLFVSCQQSAPSNESTKKNPRPRISLKSGCAPEADLLATNIVRGTPVAKLDADSKAAVMILAANDENFLGICTAQLVGAKTLLTAAHCLLPDANRYYIVFHPSISCESGFNLQRDSKRATRAIRHESFNDSPKPELMVADIGLLFLDEEAPAGYKIYTIANPNEITAQPEMLIYGFGRTNENESGSGIMRRATVPSNKYQINMGENKVIIDQQDSTGICVGDSGGASFVQMGSQLQILGINSYVSGETGNRCSANGYQTLAYIYKDWIETKIKENEEIKEAR